MTSAPVRVKEVTSTSVRSTSDIELSAPSLYEGGLGIDLQQSHPIRYRCCGLGIATEAAVGAATESVASKQRGVKLGVRVAVEAPVAG